MVFIFVWRWLRNKQVLLTYRSGSAEYRSVIGRSTSYLATGSSRDAEHFIMWSILGPRKIKNKTVGDKHEVCFVRLSQLWQLNKPRDRQWMFYSLVDLGLPGSIIFTVYRNIINIGTVVLWGTVSRELMLVSVYPCNSRRAIAWHQYHFSNGLERYTMLSTKEYMLNLLPKSRMVIMPSFTSSVASYSTSWLWYQNCSYPSFYIDISLSEFCFLYSVINIVLLTSYTLSKRQ